MMANNLTDISKQLPGDIDGWKKEIEHTLYDSKTLFKYINGGAELYISYNFKHVLAQKYKKGEGKEISVDIFDMGDSFNAFGVFSHSSEVPDKVENRIGQGSEYAAGLLTFWKDRYYVSVLAYPETEEKRKTVLEIGRDIARAISAEGPMPPILKMLPPENLITERIIYFTHHNWLNSHFYVADDNILDIHADTPAVLAKYKEADDKLFVLLVTYPDKKKVEAAYKNFLTHYLPNATDGVKKLEDGRWTGCKLDGQMIAVILDAPTQKSVETLLKKISTAQDNIED